MLTPGPHHAAHTRDAGIAALQEDARYASVLTPSLLDGIDFTVAGEAPVFCLLFGARDTDGNAKTVPSSRSTAMNEWEILRKWKVPVGALVPAPGSGATMLPWRYQVEHAESGEVKTVAASDEYDIGEKLSEEDFEDAG